MSEGVIQMAAARQRSPDSLTLRWARLTARRTLLKMIRFIIGLMGLPEFPDNGQPAIRQAAIGRAVGAAVRAHVLPIGLRPR